VYDIERLFRIIGLPFRNVEDQTRVERERESERELMFDTDLIYCCSFAFLPSVHRVLFSNTMFFLRASSWGYAMFARENREDVISCECEV